MVEDIENPIAHNRMKITKDTRVSDILKEYGDIADVMEVFGVKRVGRYSIRKVLTRFLTVKRAAFVHRIPLDEFLKMLHNAVQSKYKAGIDEG
ncbi:DUF1858 domain-containing protein [Chloroflexota bacterium]